MAPCPLGSATANNPTISKLLRRGKNTDVSDNLYLMYRRILSNTSLRFEKYFHPMYSYKYNSTPALFESRINSKFFQNSVSIRPYWLKMLSNFFFFFGGGGNEATVKSKLKYEKFQGILITYQYS